MCGFIKHAEKGIDEKHMREQFHYAIETQYIDKVEEIGILTIGSFLNENEVLSGFRRYALSLIARMPQVKRVTIESRPEYITCEKLSECKQIMGNKILECGRGLESSDDFIRNTLLNKILTKEEFEEKVALYKEADVNLSVYILVKPVGLLEEEAIESAKYVFYIAKEKGIKARVAFEPVFVCKNTPLEKEFLNGNYTLLNFWSIIYIFKKVHHLGEIYVVLNDEELSDGRVPHSCEKCNDLILQKLKEFNMKQDINLFKNLDCDCRYLDLSVAK